MYIILNFTDLIDLETDCSWKCTRFWGFR